MYLTLVSKINQNCRKTRLFFHICFQRVLYQFDFVWAPFWLPWSSLLASLGPIWSALWLLLAPLASILGVQRRPWPPFSASTARSEAFLDRGSPTSALQARFGSSLASFQAPSLWRSILTPFLGNIITGKDDATRRPCVTSAFGLVRRRTAGQ